MKENEFVIRHLLEIRRHAIEMGATAERLLIAAGELREEDRRIITRATSRRGTLHPLEPVKVDTT
jgi:hypothetical protein